MSASALRLRSWTRGRCPACLPKLVCAPRRGSTRRSTQRGRPAQAATEREGIKDRAVPSSVPADDSDKAAPLESPLDVLEKEERIEFSGEQLFLYVGSAVAFGLGILYFEGATKAEEFFTGYLLEQSLSVDNLFVFILCFEFFKTPREYQSKVLNIGILTAAVLRLVMILAGVELVENFKPLLLVFAAILLFSSYKLLFVEKSDGDEDLSQNAIVKAVNKVFVVTDGYRGDAFFVLEDGIRKATPLLVALAVIEISDVIFAVDSIPAVFGVTLDPFIIYTSNMFAILSLRGLYGFVASIINELRYLDKAVALVLGFIGFKMIAAEAGFVISNTVSLSVVAATLAAGAGASLLLPAPAEDEP